MERLRRRISSSDNINRLERALNELTASRTTSPAREDSSDDATAEETFKGSLGLNLLRDVTEPVIDFIFVHGLGGGSRKTWSFSSNKYHYWPKEWLSQDPEFSCVRIHSFGYKADWSERKESVLDIHDFALSLLGEIEHAPHIRRSKTKIVFVAHSMGGLVIKKAYILAREDPSLKELASRIHTLYFLATPHRGSDLTKTLMNIVKVSYGQKTFLSELERNSASITSINDSFRHFAESVQLWSFYETVPSSLVLMSSLIVDKASATLGYAGEKISLLNADHRGVCKFDLPSNPNYKILRNAFITTIDTILSEISTIASESSRFQHSQLVELTGITEPPVNDLLSLEDVRSIGSCEWLASRPSYVCWQTPWSESPPFFWLTGNAGSGKSFLCSQIINDLQKQNQRCSYFFFRNESTMESTIAGCLRALAYQMAMSDEAVLRRVLEVEQDSVPCSQWDERTIWRKLFIGCIFKVSRPLPQFWVIDALDECPRFSALINLVATAPLYLRIFVSSRSIPEAEKILAQLGDGAERYQIQSADTLIDLGIFINSKMDRLPAGNEQGQIELKEKLLRKSSGSFLWVSLIVQELEQAYSEEDAEEILDEVPEDMNKLYARMLESLPNNARAIRLAKSIFTWTLFSLRALTLDEMQYAVKLDINQTVHNLGRSISAICGQLVGVDNNNRCHSIHQTAQAFLLEQNIVPGLMMDKQRSHTRIGQLCLKLLAGNMSHRVRLQGISSGSSTSIVEIQLVEYASLYFSDHLLKSSSEDSIIWSSLCEFLDNSVPYWIEFLARKGKTYHVIRTAKNLRAYLMRRLKHMNPLSAGRETLESWINDMIKLIAKFKSVLSVMPSSIHNFIPAMCPSDSIIAKSYASRQQGFSVKGLASKDWDDCLARIEYLATQSSAVALGDRYLAVAGSDDTISLYYQDSFQMKSTLKHGERTKLLILSSDCLYLASSGPRKVKVWDTENETQLWVFDTAQQVLSMKFVLDDKALLTATQGGYTNIWDLREGFKGEHWHWNVSTHESESRLGAHQPPGKVLLSPHGTVLAACYRGLPIYLFDLTKNNFMGCCSRRTESHTTGRGVHYLVDALAFNPNSEIDMLVVSYGDGELVIFDLSSTELRHCIPDVFAHSLACSPDGRTLVAGSSRGSIKIFEFGGIEGEKLSLIYCIDAYEDGIRSIAFSNDGLRFADICGSQCRVWEPAILVRSEKEEGSQSEVSSSMTLVPKSAGMLEMPENLEISAICYDHLGDFAFCGKQDGSVVCFETRNATQQGTIYRHATGTRITCIIFLEQRSLLVTADESGRVIVKKVTLCKETYETSVSVAEVRSEGAITAILPDPLASRILIQGNRHVEIWTLEGEKLGFSTSLEVENDNAVISNHPLRADCLIVLDGRAMRMYSWADGLEMLPLTYERFGAMIVQVTPPSPHASRIMRPEKLLDLKAYQSPANFIARFPYKRSSSVPSSSHGSILEIWPATSIPVSDTGLRPEPLPDLGEIALKVCQIITIAGNQLFFLDRDYWICSLDLTTKPALFQYSVNRHFFLLSEWRSAGSGGTGFMIRYSPLKREFVIAAKHRLLVIKRGLDFAESWSIS